MDYLSELKEKYRLNDMDVYINGVSGEEIMRRNCAISPEAARDTIIHFYLSDEEMQNLREEANSSINIMRNLIDP